MDPHFDAARKPDSSKLVRARHLCPLPGPLSAVFETAAVTPARPGRRRRRLRQTINQSMATTPGSVASTQPPNPTNQSRCVALALCTRPLSQGTNQRLGARAQCSAGPTRLRKQAEDNVARIFLKAEAALVRSAWPGRGLLFGALCSCSPLPVGLDAAGLPSAPCRPRSGFSPLLRMSKRRERDAGSFGWMSG